MDGNICIDRELQGWGMMLEMMLMKERGKESTRDMKMESKLWKSTAKAKGVGWRQRRSHRNTCV